MTLHCLLFDLDGTLLNTLPDLAFALNRVLQEEGYEPMLEATIRPAISYGAPGMVKLAFGDRQNKEDFARRMARMREIYCQHLTDRTRLFEGMETVLEAIESRNLKWGVVTNKRRYLTLPLLDRLGLLKRTACVVSGDDTTRGKPNPDPLWLACRQANADTSRCVYVGDAQGDIEAGHRAGMMTVAACYGYLAPSDRPEQWGADIQIDDPADLLQALGDVLPSSTLGDLTSAGVMG